METSTIAHPHNTLYISNIDWKVKKPQLRRALYMLFTRHGKVLEIITLRRDGLRGQAWVIFEDVQTATDALQKEQGFTLFGKDLKIAYANEKSDRIAKRDGSYIPKAKRRKRKQDAADAAAAAAAAATAPSADGSSAPSTDGAPDGPPPPPQKPAQQPSHILFATDLPSECNEMMLAMLFRQYAGYKEVRIPRAGLAFIEFDNEPHATLALERLNGFQLTSTDELKLTYGKA